MSLSTNPLSYEDIRSALDRALASDNGIKITLPNPGLAIHFRQRCNKFRALDRAASKKTYPDPEDPKHGTSAYDVLTISLEENVALILKRDPSTLLVEEL